MADGDFVLVQGGWPEFRFGTSEAVFLLSSYDADLGMKRRAEVKRQLELDVPRTRVRINGVPTSCWKEVYRHTRFPRMCTQAVLAPVVEWFRNEGVFMFERRTPMYIDIDHGRITVRKLLGLKMLDGLPIGNAHVTIQAAGTNAVISVTVS